MKNIIHTQDTFTIYYEGKPALKENLQIKLEGYMVKKVVPMIDKIDYYFRNHEMTGYVPKVQPRPTRHANGRFIAQS